MTKEVQKELRIDEEGAFSVLRLSGYLHRTPWGGTDRSAPWITLVRRFSLTEIFAFLSIPRKQRFRIPVGVLKIAVPGKQGEERLAILANGGQEVKILRVHFPQQIQKLYAQGHGLQKRFVCDVQVNAAAQGALVLGGRGAEIHRRGFHARTAQSVEGSRKSLCLDERRADDGEGVGGPAAFGAVGSLDQAGAGVQQRRFVAGDVR